MCKELVVSVPCRRCALGFICVVCNCKNKRCEICGTVEQLSVGRGSLGKEVSCLAVILG